MHGLPWSYDQRLVWISGVSGANPAAGSQCADYRCTDAGAGERTLARKMTFHLSGRHEDHEHIQRRP
jgi:hypothetical protein